jgi:signal transduction histidine kinase
MRRTPLDGKTLQEALLELVKDFETASEKTIQMIIPDDFPTMSSQIALTIFRAVQEGLTNIQKHAADAGEIKIQLANISGQLNLKIVDDGSVSTIANTTSGFGLAGLQERVEQLGGRLRYSPLIDKGFEVYIILPLPGESYD